MRLCGAVRGHGALLAAPALGARRADIRYPGNAPGRAPRRAAAGPPARAGMERRIRRLRPSADDRRRRSARPRRISAIASAAVAAGRAPRRHARDVRRYTAGLTPDLRIMDLLDSQPEFTKAIWDYLDMLVNDERIAQGPRDPGAIPRDFDAVEKAYGVDRYIIAAIWGVESNYGTMIGDRTVIRSTATLACIGRRQDYFRDEFLSALEILAARRSAPDRLNGSWAGAFGPTQFMPTAFKRYAVDFDGDGRRDVVDSVPDLIASTANNLKKDGWVAGPDLGLRGRRCRQDFNFLLADRSRTMTIAQWERLGIRRAGGKPFPRRRRAPICWCRPARRGRAS